MGFYSYREKIFLGVVFQILTTSSLFKICYAKGFNAGFIFGDSLVDAGNNNYIDTLSKANYLPNGIDFGNPTGRFTNGKTIVDILGKFLLTLFATLVLIKKSSAKSNTSNQINNNNSR